MTQWAASSRFRLLHGFNEPWNVLLSGVFADSPSLRSCSSRLLATMRNYRSDEMKLITPEDA